MVPEIPPLAHRFFTQNTALAGSDVREGLEALREAAPAKGGAKVTFPSRLPHLGPVPDYGRQRPRTWESGAEGPPPRRGEKRRKDPEGMGCRAHPAGGVQRSTVVRRLQVKG